jgi:hypothetical protein
MKFFLFFSLLGVCLQVMAQVTSRNTFQLTGKMVGQDTGYVQLDYLNSANKYVRDSSYLKKGEFSFSGAITEPVHAFFYITTKSRGSAELNLTDIFLEPDTMHAVFRINKFKEGEITGSKAQKDFEVYTKQDENIKAKWKNMFNDLDMARSKHDTANVTFILNNQLPLYFAESDSLKYDFIKQYPASYVSGFF